MTEKTPLSEKIATEEAIKTFKNSMGKEWIEVKDVRASIQNILERIMEISGKTASGRNRLPGIILFEVEEIIKQEVGTLADKEEDLKNEWKNPTWWKKND